MATNMKIYFALTFCLLFSINVFAENVSCAFAKKMEDMKEIPECGLLMEDGLLMVKKELIKDIKRNLSGYACIIVFNTREKTTRGWYLVNRKGRGRITSFWTDNDCGPFSAGLNVGVLNDSVIFYDRSFNIAKKTSYVWASGFNNGYSKVCLAGLKSEPDQHGDHLIYSGGPCGYIDRKFRIVIPIEYPYESTPEP